MDDIFVKLIEDYKHDINTNDKIRLYILNNVYTMNNLTEYVDLFSKTALEIGDEVGYAFSFGMYFWLYHGSDIELAHKYNQKALSLFKKIKNYKYQKGYLSVLNNELIYSNYKGKLLESYNIMYEGMTIAEETQNINYFLVFSINGVYLLLDLGLYDKASELVKKIDQNDVCQSKSDKAIVLTLKYKTNLYLSKFDESYKWVSKLEEYNNKEKILDQYIIDAYLLQSYICLNNIDKANEVYRNLLDDINNDDVIDKVDLNVSYLALARYYKYIKNDLEAYKYYKLIYPTFNSLLGSKKQYLDEALDVFYKHDKDLYLNASKDKIKFTDDINKTLINICNSSNNIYDNFINFRYEFLFKKMEKLNAFIRKLNEANNKDDIYKLIQDNIKEVLNAKFVTCRIENNDYTYKNINLSKIDKIKYFREIELPENARNECDELGVIKIFDKKNNKYLFIFMGFVTTGNLELKENLYLISLIRELLIPIFYQIERYNEALDNYTHDELTHLLNRYGFDNLITDVFKENVKYYLLMMDIDDFKLINDTYGHTFGDKVLVEVSKILLECLSNRVARIGGEEFIGLVNINVNIEEVLDNILNKIRNLTINGVHVSISIGVDILNDASDLTWAKSEADKKLYKAKANKKNQYVI